MTRINANAIRGESVILVDFDESFITDEYLGWLNDPVLMRYSRQRFVRHDRNSSYKHFVSTREGAHHFWAITQISDGAFIGTLTAYVEASDGVADIGILIGHSEARGKGYGRDAWGAAMRHLFETAGIRKVTAGTSALNGPMRRICEHWGMSLEGTLREQQIVEGTPAAVLLYGLTRSEWDAAMSGSMSARSSLTYGHSWDEWNRAGGPRYPHEKVVQFTFRNFPDVVRRGRRALDLGCGSGVHTEFLAAEGFDTTAVDRSIVGIENTRRRLAARGLVATLAVQDLGRLDLPAQSFDLVICISVLDAAGLPAARSAMPAIARALSSGARGLFLFASDRDFRVTERSEGYELHGWSRAEVDQLFRSHFSTLHIDRYITTYGGGVREQNDWLVTVQN